MRSYVNRVYVDGTDVTGSVYGNLRSWPVKKTITFNAAATDLSVYANDAEKGCQNGGFALKCTSADPRWNINTNSKAGWKVWSHTSTNGVPPVVGGKPWYQKGYDMAGARAASRVGSGFMTPRFGSTTYADRGKPLAPRPSSLLGAPFALLAVALPAT